MRQSLLSLVLNRPIHLDARHEVIDARLRRFHQPGVIERGMHRPCMDVSAPVAKPVGVIAIDMNPFLRSSQSVLVRPHILCQPNVEL